MEALRSRTMTALVYPALLLGVGLVVLGFLLGWVLPGFADVLKDGSEQLSPLARFILSVGVTLGETRTLWMGVLAGLTVLGGVVLSRPTLRQAAVQRAARLPGLRLTLRLLHASRYFSTVATLTQGGMPAVAALQLATPLLLPEGQRHMAAAVRALQQGQDLARSVSSHAGPRHADVFGDAVVGRLLAVGQRTGALSHTLERIAALLESRTSRRVERWSRSLEPVLMVLLGLLIGGVVLLMYVPLIELSAGMP
jgi:general secretion pathway protein F